MDSSVNNQRIKAQGGMFPTYFKQYQPLDTDITIEAKTDKQGHLRLKSYKIGTLNPVTFEDDNNANVFDEKYINNVLPKMKVQSDSLVKAQAWSAAADAAAAAAAAGAVEVPVNNTGVPNGPNGPNNENVEVPVNNTGVPNGPNNENVEVPVNNTGVPNGSDTVTPGGAKNIFPLFHSKKSRSYKSKTGKKKVIRRNKSRKYRK
jgi:hypothetical protein